MVVQIRFTTVYKANRLFFALVIEPVDYWVEHGVDHGQDLGIDAKYIFLIYLDTRGEKKTRNNQTDNLVS